MCADGFDLDAIADAVFLDLPRPWEALDSAIRALKVDLVLLLLHLLALTRGFTAADRSSVLLLALY